MKQQTRDALFLNSELARGKLKDFASLLKVSSSRLNYTLGTLKKEGILGEPYCIFDYSYFDVLLFKVYFKGAYISETDKLRIIKELLSNAYAVAVYELTGEFDLVVEFVSPNPSRFNKVLRSLAEAFPTLRHHKIVLNIVTYLYPRTYMTRSNLLHPELMQEIVIGGDREALSFSEQEMAVFQSLLNAPTKPVSFLAKKAEMHVKTFKTILSDMVKTKVIRGFKHVIDTNLIGINRFVLFLKLHNLSNERETALREYLLHTKEVTGMNKTVGDWDMEITIESFERKRIRALTSEIRESFNAIIETFNIMEFFATYKRAYLPSQLFNKEEQQK